MSDVAKVIERVRSFGADIVIDGGRLQIVNTAKLPDTAMPFIRQRGKEIAAYLDTEAQFEERAAIIEHDSGVPKTEAEQFARLLMARCPKDVDPADWSYFISRVPEAIEQGLAA